MKRTHISLKSNHQFFIINQKEILYFFTSKLKTEVMLKNGKNIKVDTAILNLEQELNHQLFFQTHVNYHINIKAIDLIFKKKTQWYIVLTNKTELPMDKSSMELFKKRFIIA